MFSRHYDYALVIWNELLELVNAKWFPSKARKFVPFQRFLQMFIKAMMYANENIPARLHSEKGPAFVMTRIRQHTEVEDMDSIMPVPPELIALADQNAKCVIDYKRVIDPIVQPEPVELAQGSPHDSVVREELEIEERVQEQGLPKQGSVMREK